MPSKKIVKTSNAKKSQKQTKRDLKKRNKKITIKKDNFLKEKFLSSTANLLIKAVSIAANAAIVNREVGKRLNRRGKEALTIVSQLAVDVRNDVKQGVRAAKKIQAKKNGLKNSSKTRVRRLSA
ncbi:MAG: hypothetical protein US86_C0001G0288 [Candidatus Daviesbacteria bacterium GW2011_GWA2_38_24]|uniref:Uncharacterized protein n=1 Tax=Candidatus Daviesbacteria bacterium GW2011_GWA2_38_24 TaxID=1618422 RepID=A0A0G0MR07_9BACT|nr:MAG: hypothetical protein US86_C0001G0288 [Candidatus Daviesbacteria bacterium GW2011_GWA2_38_24]KKQ78638.1 MAG: hypothetical protein UT01_C0064G0010 [Candidatus Daviesbacteria bacterium GW2011_GWA1_38_7]